MRITQQTSRESMTGSWTRSSLQVNQKARRKVMSNHRQEPGGVWLAGGRGQEEVRQQRGVAAQPVSHRLWRSTGSPAPEQGPPRRGSVWGQEAYPDTAVGTLQFPGNWSSGNHVNPWRRPRVWWSCVHWLVCLMSSVHFPPQFKFSNLVWNVHSGERKSGLKPGQSTAIAFCVPDLCVSAEWITLNALFYLIPNNFVEIVLTFPRSLFRELLRDTHSFDHWFIPQSWVSSYHVLGNEVTRMRKTESHSHGTYIVEEKTGIQL